MSRATDRAARRPPLGQRTDARDSATTARFPGAKSAFGLLGEVLLIGILMAIVSLPVITIPAALAAGVRHLRRYLKADDSGSSGSGATSGRRSSAGSASARHPSCWRPCSPSTSTSPARACCPADRSSAWSDGSASRRSCSCSSPRPAAGRRGRVAGRVGRAPRGPRGPGRCGVPRRHGRVRRRRHMAARAARDPRARLIALAIVRRARTTAPPHPDDA